MKVRAINLAEKLALVGELWAPKTVAALNDYDIKVVKADGEFAWHDHAATDELFLVLNAQLTIRLEDSEVVLNPGELYVVPRGRLWGTQIRPRRWLRCFERRMTRILA